MNRLGARERAFLSIAVAAVLVAMLGLAASLFVKSPAQQAADAAPPDPTVLTAPVERRILENSVGVRGTVVATASVDIRPAVGGDDRGVVTAINKSTGAEVAEGDVLAQISGRPILVLGGAVPAYRDLLPSAEGADVQQFESALNRLGLLADDNVDDFFGTGTQEAVGKLYAERGFSPRTTADLNIGEATERRAVESQVRAAERAFDEAKAAADAAGPTDTRASLALRFAEEDLTAARDAEDAFSASTGVFMPFSEIAYVSTFPARVASVEGVVGASVSELTGPLLVLQTGGLVIEAIVPPGSEAQIRSGLPVKVIDDVNRAEAAATVVELGEFTQAVQSGAEDAAVAPEGYPLQVGPIEPLAGEWLGRDVRIVIVVDETAQPALVVPLAALSSLPDGSSYVTVRRSNDTEVRVPVEVGLVTTGEAAVEPIDVDALIAGDMVIVG